MNMNRKRIFCTCLAAIAAVTAVGASGAQAAKQLVLSSGGVALPKGSTAFSELNVASCLQFAQGKITVNQQPKDTLSFKPSPGAHCESDIVPSGGIQKAELTSGGVAKYTGNYQLTTPGPCVYKYPHFKGHFPIPGFAVVVGEQVGALIARESAHECPKTRSELFEADVDIAAFGAPLETDFAA